MVNPLLPGFYPDPSVCVVEGRYYLANSSFEYFPGIPLHSSDDFENWKPIGHAIDRQGQLDLGAAYDSGGLYAPALRYHEGTFYIACTNFTGDSVGSSFYITATDPAGDWSDAVVLPDAVGFDPSLFFEGDTVWWIECREKTDPQFPGDTEVWMRQLDLAAGRLVGPEHVVWQPALRGAVWAEGPHIIARDGWYYLVSAEGGTEYNHAVMVARSRSVTGPYEGMPHNPLVTHRHLGRDFPVANVGHADLVEGPDGQWRAVLLASRQDSAGRVILGRETFGVEVAWEDGWPVVNPGVGAIRDVASCPHSEAAGPARSADLLTIRGPQDSVADDDAGVVLTAPCTGVWHRLRHQDCRVEVTVDLLDAGSAAALVLRQSDAFQLALAVSGGRARLIERRAGADTELASVPAVRPRVLSAEVLATGVRFAVDGLPLGDAPLDVLSTTVAGGFVGTLFGVRSDGLAHSRVRLESWSYDGR